MRALKFLPSMSNVPVVYPKDLVKVLLKQGFIKSRQKGSHIRLLHPDGRATTISLHNKPLYKGTLFAILRQVKLTPDEIKKFL